MIATMVAGLRVAVDPRQILQIEELVLHCVQRPAPEVIQLQIQSAQFGDDVTKIGQVILFVVFLVFAVRLRKWFIAENSFLEMLHKLSRGAQVVRNLGCEFGSVSAVESEQQLVQLKHFSLADHFDHKQRVLVFTEQLFEFFDERESAEHPVGLAQVHFVVGAVGEGEFVVVLFSVAVVAQVENAPMLPQQRPAQLLLALPPIGDDFVLETLGVRGHVPQVQIDVRQLRLQ